ncbi:hypothetical protein EON65_48570, partial [archaeon]
MFAAFERPNKNMDSSMTWSLGLDQLSLQAFQDIEYRDSPSKAQQTYAYPYPYLHPNPHLSNPFFQPILPASSRPPSSTS